MALTALGIAGIGAGVQALTGLGQALFAGKKKKEPKYEIPKEVFEATELARGMAATAMPEASRMQALQGAQQSALFASKNLANLGRGAALSGVGNVQAQLDRSALSVASQDAAMRQQNMLNYQRALQYQAGEQKLKFQTEHASWMNKEQQRRANVGAGFRGMFDAADNISSIAMMSALGGGGFTTGRRGANDGVELSAITSGYTRAQNALSGIPAITQGVTGPGSIPGSQLSPRYAYRPTFGAGNLPSTMPGGQFMGGASLPGISNYLSTSPAMFSSLMGR